MKASAEANQPASAGKEQAVSLFIATAVGLSLLLVGTAGEEGGDEGQYLSMQSAHRSLCVCRYALQQLDSPPVHAVHAARSGSHDKPCAMQKSEDDSTRSAHRSMVARSTEKCAP